MTTTAGPSSYVFGNLAGERMPVAARGEGVYLYDDAGRRYLDACAGAACANIGHGVREIGEAMAAQAGRLAFVNRGAFSNEPAEELAAVLAGRAGGAEWRVFMASSGSDANEAAIKLALQYWRERGRAEKTVVVGRRNSYHGSTLGALGVGGHTLRREAWSAVLPTLPWLAEASCYRCEFGRTEAGCDLPCAEDLERILATGSGRIAAVVLEPVVGAASAAVAPPIGYLRRIAEICRERDVLLVTDEVMSGVYRTGPFLAAEHDGVTPDLVVMGKGLAAGYAPLAAVLVSDRIRNALARGSRVFHHGHTHSFHPVSAAAGLAVLRYVDAHGVAANARSQGPRLRRGLERLAGRHPIIGSVRGRGMLQGVELVADRATKRPLQGGARASFRVAALLKERGLVVLPSGADLVSAFLVTPPLTITAAEVDELLDLLDHGLEALEAQELRKS